jgi:phosphomannomutase
MLGEAVGRLRAAPPTHLSGRPVTAFSDLAKGVGLPPADVLIMEVDLGADDGGRGRVVVRPSGTEPKLKLYFEVVRPLTGTPEAARTWAADEIGILRRATVSALGLS